jgi:hypothetical protein
MPPDNAQAVDPGADVAFPENGPIANTNIGRASDSAFLLNAAGTYLILFSVGVTEAGQLLLTLDGADLPYTVAGRTTETSPIIGTAIVTVSVAGAVLTVRNPAGNAAALTVTPVAGGERPVSAHLIIAQIA